MPERTTRAIVHREFDEPSDVRGVEEVPLPEAGPAEVRTRTTTSPTHDHDLWTIGGTHPAAHVSRLPSPQQAQNADSSLPK